MLDTESSLRFARDTHDSPAKARHTHLETPSLPRTAKGAPNEVDAPIHRLPSGRGTPQPIADLPVSPFVSTYVQHHLSHMDAIATALQQLRSSVRIAITVSHGPKWPN